MQVYFKGGFLMKPFNLIFNSPLLILLLIFTNSILSFGYPQNSIRSVDSSDQQNPILNYHKSFHLADVETLGIEDSVPFQNQKISSIDQNDTIFLDLPASTLVGNSIEFPVNFSSDDYVYAVDFALKYNNQNVEFDTIINITPGLNYLYYLNPNDSVLRFTSYRLGQIQNGSNVVKLRFTSPNGIICYTDFTILTGYLNGDQCSIVSDSCSQIPNSIDSPSNSPLISIFPNPANNALNIKSPPFSYLEIFDSRLNLILEMNLDDSLSSIDVSDFGAGIYFLKFASNGVISWEKVMIAR